MNTNRMPVGEEEKKMGENLDDLLARGGNIKPSAQTHELVDTNLQSGKKEPTKQQKERNNKQSQEQNDYYQYMSNDEAHYNNSLLSGQDSQHQLTVSSLNSSSSLKTSRSLSMIIGDRRTPPPVVMKPILGGNQQHLSVQRLHSQYSMPCSLNSKPGNRGNPYQIHHSLLDERIINCQLSIAAKKDFREEVRALVDVRKFVSDSFILTDITEVRIGAIVEKIVDRLVGCRGLDETVAVEAKSLLFVEQTSLSMLLANTMQGLYKSRADGRLAYDNSWVVATGNLSSLHKRQVAIARFPQPVNFGRQSQEVRFLIIVLAPNKEKLTKSAWETGRTFATMFTDINFRRRLLRAKCQEEFKVELLTRAEGLARESEEEQFDSNLVTCQYYKQKQNNHNNQVNHNHHHQDLFTAKHENNKGRKPKVFSARDFQFPKNQFSGTKLNSTTTSSSSTSSSQQSSSTLGPCCGSLFGSLASGLVDDFRRRSKYYLSDFTDGILGDRSLYKTISTTVFLYFSVLLPCIAFGVVDTNNTEGHIDPKKTIIGQAIGGLFFAMFSGQPLIVIMTTAPLCIYVKVIYEISQDLEVEFSAFYASVGLWMCFFLIIMSITNSSNLMKYCTRSTEDIFALFTAFAFGLDGVKEATRSFNKYYWEPDCTAHGTVLVSRTLPESSAITSSENLNNQQLNVDNNQVASNYQQQQSGATHFAHNLTSSIFQSIVNPGKSNMTPSVAHIQATYTTSPLAADLTEHLQHNPPEQHDLIQHNDLGAISRCQRETCILFLFLMSGTLWLANSFNSFNKTPYLSSRKREIIKDYALAISVIIFSFIGSYLFSDIRLDVFEFSEFTGLHFAQINQLPPKVVAVACLLGFMLSVLFYIDQNICGAMVNNAPYKLKKGDYFHLDLLILAALNVLLSLTGLPWMHGKLPHSHLHSKALADYEERVDDGHVHQTIVNIRETRLTGLLTSILVGLSLLAVPYPLSYIPLPVLSGVFLYTALAEFKSNSMVERICLLFTEQAAYPPNHYIRRCPQRKIHFFTITQIAQLAIVSFIGFYPNPYVNMAFPLAVATFVPLRDKLLPYVIDIKYLNSLDSPSLELC